MSDIVIYVGIFSKVLFPALRIGYLVVPHNSVNIFGYAKYLADRQVRKTGYQERNIFRIPLSLDQEVSMRNILY